MKAKNVARFDHRFHGWVVSVRRGGRRYYKYFSDSRHGGRRGSFRAAVRYRDGLLRKLPPALAVRRLGNGAARGVYVERDSGGRAVRYGASWTTVRGERRRRTFAVGRFGGGRAKELARRARAEGLREVRAAFGRLTRLSARRRRK
ncbi:MAG TPA: hypothetical protein VKA01_02925 [Vicinamibacteria bacterium]|nr:hypothetical protein [Vicinamibacteria bacterium]